MPGNGNHCSVKHRTKLSRGDAGAGWDQCFGEQNHSDWSGDAEYIVHCGVKKKKILWIKKKTIYRNLFQYRQGVTCTVWGFQWRGHFQVGWRCASTVVLKTRSLQSCSSPKETKARNAISIQHCPPLACQSLQWHLCTVLACCAPGPELCLFVQIAAILRSRERVLPGVTRASSQQLHKVTTGMGGITFMDPHGMRIIFPRALSSLFSPSLSLTWECLLVTIPVYICSEEKNKNLPTWN